MTTGVLTETAEGVILQLKIQPRAAKNEITGAQGEELKVRLTSPPVDGAANSACRDFFAGLLDLPKSNITIVAGEKSRHKRLLIRTHDLAALRRQLASWIPS